MNTRSKRSAMTATLDVVNEATEFEPPQNLVAELADAFGLSSYNLVSFSLAVDGESVVVNGEYKVNAGGNLTTRIKKLGLKRA